MNYRADDALCSDARSQSTESSNVDRAESPNPLFDFAVTVCHPQRRDEEDVLDRVLESFALAVDSRTIANLFAGSPVLLFL